MQAQLDFGAHSGSQPQLGPEGAVWSQYQPVGQRASPHGAQVPSSQVARGGALGSVESSLALASESPLS